jgi:hypothetical protein
MARTHSESDVPALGSAIKSAAKSERGLPAVTTAAEMLTYAAEREIAWVFLARSPAVIDDLLPFRIDIQPIRFQPFFPLR